MAAVERGAPGVYNVVDDEPAPVATWLPYLAEVLGAKKPMRVPDVAGPGACWGDCVVMMTELRGASNAKARHELGWTPAHATLARRVPGAGGCCAGAGWRRVTETESLLAELRPVAFGIAYRMLGSVSEAEDVVQEALLRVHRALGVR